MRQLRELIDALEARVPMIERIGEIQIARDAALLKKSALQRITELRNVTVLSSTWKETPWKETPMKRCWAFVRAFRLGACMTSGPVRQAA